MTTPLDPLTADGVADAAWERAGLRAGASLDSASLVVVLGNDVRETALAAVGLARAQAAHRRVALGDLLGEAEPIQRLLTSDDPHGLVDSFLYGVSLNRIAHYVPTMGELFVLPSGSEPPDYDEILPNARWKRLASGFRESGALFVVAAPADAPHAADFARMSDGAVLVADAELPPDDGVPVHVLGRVPAPEADVVDEPEVVSERAIVLIPIAEPEPTTRARTSSGRFAQPVAAVAGLLLVASLAAIGVWLAARPLASGHEPAVRRRGASTSTAAGALSTALDTLAHSVATSPVDSAAPALLPVNLADSSVASAYSVALMTMNTQAGAIWWFQTSGKELPAATFAPTLVQGAPWYRALVGAYANRAQADSLLAALRASGKVRAGLGDVVRAPFAFLVDSVKPDAVAGLLKYFADRGQPVYSLRQKDGSERLYAGAFETREQAGLFVESIRASGLRPVLVYRIGRVN
jgi:septal ring-binding cell division protein DamX